MFFFEKKNQKTFSSRAVAGNARARLMTGSVGDWAAKSARSDDPPNALSPLSFFMLAPVEHCADDFGMDVIEVTPPPINPVRDVHTSMNRLVPPGAMRA